MYKYLAAFLYIIYMKKVLITDTHFGVRQNSLTWLKSQEDFIYNQLIPFIKNETEPITLVHCGDVFDSRSSISTFIASRVINIFNALKEVCEEIIVVSGNHDFYSPNSDEIDTNILLLQQTGITILSKDILIRDKDLYVPWYCWFEQDKLQKIIDENNIENVFTHADLMDNVTIKGPKIFSGHIHIPNISGRHFTLGSTYALNFADANQDRGFYTLTEKEIKFYPNIESIKFYKFTEIPEIEVNDNDYINLYIDIKDENLLNSVKDWIKNKRNCTIFPIEKTHEIYEVNSEEYNIENICKNMIPDKLKDKFEMLLY